MDTYKTEEAQVEELKKWFLDNGRTVLTGVVIAALVVFSVYSWQVRQQQKQEAASIAYQNLVQAIQQLENQPTPELTATTRHLADTLKKEFAGTTYAQFAALFNAKLAVQASDLALAESELRWVLDNKPAAEIKSLAQLRLARILHAKGDDKGALALLEEKNAGGYAAAFAQLRGDIALASGDSDGARTLYEHAQELERKQSNPVNDPLLEMKLHDLQAGDATEAGDATKAAGEATKAQKGS